MKFSKSLIATLRNFATIYNGIYLQEGQFIMTRSQNTAIYAEVHLKNEDYIDCNVAISDLNEFLSILSLSGEDSEITLKGNRLLIKGKRSEISWPVSDPSQVVHPKKAIKFPDPCVEFEMTAEDYNQMTKISRALGADTIAITNREGIITINAYKKIVDLNLEHPVSSFQIAEYTGASDFNFVINLQNMKLLSDAYKVKLWAKDNLFATMFEGEVSSYVIAVETGSTHNF